jgi:hypothetical protein
MTSLKQLIDDKHSVVWLVGGLVILAAGMAIGGAAFGGHHHEHLGKRGELHGRFGGPGAKMGRGVTGTIKSFNDGGLVLSTTGGDWTVAYDSNVRFQSKDAPLNQNDLHVGDRVRVLGQENVRNHGVKAKAVLDLGPATPAPAASSTPAGSA